MKYPQANFLIKLFTPSIFGMLVCIFAAALSASAQTKTGALLLPNPSASLGQCRNGSAGESIQCVELTGGSRGWVNGNAGAENSQWAEDEFIAYRMVFDNLAITGTHSVILGYDIFHNGKHAIDYLGSFNATETDADPCSGTPLACTVGSPTSVFPIGPDGVTVTNQINPFTGVFVTQDPGNFTMWGGTITGFTYLPYTLGDVERRVQITFTAAVPNPVLAWGGHIAWRGDWGAGNSAGGVSGSPYHMRLKDLDGAGGNQDRSLTVAAPRGVVVIIKQVLNATFSSPTPFTFLASAFFNPLQFSLTDDNGGPGVDVNQSLAISGATSLSVIEGDLPNFTLLGVSCTEVGGIVNSSYNGINGVNIIVESGESIVCTFSNGTGGSSAGDGSISGRVVSSYGMGIANARMTVINGATGETTTALTNPFGYYTVDNLKVGELYLLQVAHKRYSFAEQSKTFTLNDSIADVDFVANP